MKFSKPVRSMQYFAALVCSYTILGLLIPLSSETRNTYNLDITQSHILAIIAAIPLFTVWFVAFWCVGSLQKYANTIKNGKEGIAFDRIAQGVTVITWGLVIPAFFAVIFSSITNNDIELQKIAVIVQNYVGLVFPLVGFSLIGLGTRLLLTSTSRNYASLPASRVLLVTFGLLGALYSYFVLHLRQDHLESYYLPTALLILTILVPYLYAWFSGLVAAYDIGLFAKVTKGEIYRRGLNWLAAGLVTVIVFSILLQYLNSLIIASYGGFSIDALLLLDYLILVGIGAGYAMMINGVRKLQQIEDI